LKARDTERYGSLYKAPTKSDETKEDLLIDRYISAMAKLTLYWYRDMGYSFAQIKSFLSENTAEHIQLIKKYAGQALN
jgi:hypothetical protein